MERPNSEGHAHAGTFATTHWSVVLAAGEHGMPEAREALENLCRTYWYPLYAYVRRRGYGHEDAQDLTQGFLLQLLDHDAFKRSPNLACSGRRVLIDFGYADGRVKR